MFFLRFFAIILFLFVITLTFVQQISFRLTGDIPALALWTTPERSLYVDGLAGELFTLCSASLERENAVIQTAQQPLVIPRYTGNGSYIYTLIRPDGMDPVLLGRFRPLRATIPLWSADRAVVHLLTASRERDTVLLRAFDAADGREYPAIAFTTRVQFSEAYLHLSVYQDGAAPQLYDFPLTRPAGSYIGEGIVTAHALSPDGKTLYFFAQIALSQPGYLFAWKPAQRSVQMIAPMALDEFAIAPDGRHLLLAERRAVRDYAYWLYDVRQQQQRYLTEVPILLPHIRWLSDADLRRVQTC